MPRSQEPVKDAPFAPSNVRLDALDASVTKDASIRGACVLDTDDGTIACLDRDRDGEERSYTFAIATQTGGGQLALFTFKSFRVEPGATLRVRGGLPPALVSLADMSVFGEIVVVPASTEALAGGSGHDGRDSAKGGGLGGGQGADGRAGAGGGSFCGVGGKGGIANVPASVAGQIGSPGAGGKAYGDAEIVPLVGGSAGGTGAYGNGSAGGGAIQLVAMNTLTIGSSGVVNAGGAGGRVNFDAGGSGGAILLEGSSVVIEGTVAANGGGGALSLESGMDGRPDGTGAPGGSNVGGHGSSATDTAGGNGAGIDNSGAGGGGGAGRIRINALPNKATLRGMISPSRGTCTTVGELTAATR